MLIDMILERKDTNLVHTRHGNKPYNAKDFYQFLEGYNNEGYFPVLTAFDSGTEQDIKNALNEYIISEQYNSDICEYINSVNWL